MWLTLALSSCVRGQDDTRVEEDHLPVLAALEGQPLAWEQWAARVEAAPLSAQPVCLCRMALDPIPPDAPTT